MACPRPVFPNSMCGTPGRGQAIAPSIFEQPSHLMSRMDQQPHTDTRDDHNVFTPIVSPHFVQYATRKMCNI
jgi:hypothetical protein